MDRAWALVGLLFLLAGAVVASEEPRRQPLPPELRIEQSTIFFGEVVRGEKVRATFALSNVGGDTLRVLRVKPG